MTLSKRLLFSPSLTAAALLIFLVVLLRIPSFAEPYWYGDEGIYLTIGNAMNDGAILYKDIVDHKTPLIYYFARVGSQLQFRILLMAWMIGASLAFYGIMTRLTKRVTLSALTTGVFVVITSLPLLEGNIPNGELFVMGFVLLGLWIFLTTRSGLSQMSGQPVKAEDRPSFTIRSSLPLFMAGMCMGLAILTKVPALFDAAAVFLIGWLAAWDTRQVTYILKQWLVLLLGLFTPIFLSIVYFMAIGAGSEYLQFGLLYNFHYVQNWSLGHLPAWGQSMFTLPVKGLVLVIALGKLTFLGHWIPRQVRWAVGWFYLALFASILSNRPYPHYILQVVPPLLLSLGLILHELTRARTAFRFRLARAVTFAAAVSTILVLTVVWTSLKIGMYPVISYYRNFINLSLGRITLVQYRDSFNSYLADNYAASSILRAGREDKLFIWGTNPMLYAVTGMQPVGRFTVGFHIQDLNLYQETMEAVKTEAPKYIVVMKDEQVPLPGLSSYLMSHYMPNKSFQHFTIWRRRLPSSTLETPRQ